MDDSEELDPWDLRDRGELLTTIAGRRTLRDGDVLLVVVRDPSTEQRLTTLRRLPRSEWVRRAEDDDLSEYLREQVERFGFRISWDPIRHAIFTVVVRRGFTVLSRNEGRWMNAWRYANHCCRVFTGDILLVTEHGWCHGMSGLGDHHPHLQLPALTPVG